MREKYSHFIVNSADSIMDVLKKMDSTNKKALVVLDLERFVSIVSIGDIQRAIIKGVDLTSSIQGILRQEVSFAREGDDLEIVKERMKAKRNELMPIVSWSGNLVDIIFWNDLFQDKYEVHKGTAFDLPVIIMAGGQGTRLKPLTNILPKPLIPLNEKTIIEDIMDRFVACGSNNFYISVNYKSEMIKYYFESLNSPHYKIKYFQEEKPLGTAGSLHLLKDKIHSTFFVSNCDIIIEQDYSSILEYHRENRNEITVVAAIVNYSIPYGILHTKEEGLLDSIQEKPEYIFKVNTGFYILEPQVIDEIPLNTFYPITDLIEKLKSSNRRVGVFPVNEKSWIDVGNWNEYLKVINHK